jgi:CheY-like chemotaxis protein
MSKEPPLILMVETDESLGWIVASYLSRDGYRVLCCARLEDALSAVRTGSDEAQPVLVLLDLDSLNPRDIADLARLHEADGANTPCVEADTRFERLLSFPLLLLATDPLQAAWVRRDGETPVLAKPFAIHELRQTIAAKTRPATGAGQ